MFCVCILWNLKYRLWRVFYRSEVSILVIVFGVNLDSDADSVDIIIVNEDEEEIDWKLRGRKSF